MYKLFELPRNEKFIRVLDTRKVLTKKLREKR